MRNSTGRYGHPNSPHATPRWRFAVWGIVIGLTLCFVAIGLQGCSDDDPVKPEEQNVEVDLLTFINNVSPYPPPASEFDAEKGAPFDTTLSGGGGVEVCTVRKYEMGRNMHEVVAFDPNAGALWPGCVVQGKYVKDGLLVPVSVKRSLCTVGIADLPGLTPEQMSKEVDPTQFTVAGALNEIVDDFLATGKEQASQFTFTSEETHGFEQGLLAVGVSASWPGGNLRSQFGYTWQSQSHTLLLKFTQKYYSATVNPPTSAVGYFDESVGVGDIKNYTGDGNPLCYVKSVTYGRLGILSMTSEESEETMTSSLNLAFTDIRGKGEIDVGAAYAEVLSRSTMKLLILGGDGTDGVVNLSDPIQGLMDWIASSMTLTETTRGVPISYTVAHLKDNSITRFQYATEYTQRDCAFADQPIYVSVYKLKCEGEEGGFTPALEGRWHVWLNSDIPGLDPIEKYTTGTFGDFDKNETRDLTSASWDNPMPSQAGAQFTLRVRIVEWDDLSADDTMGDQTWTFDYPDFNPGTGTCEGDPQRCEFNQLFENGGQRIRVYFRVNLDGNP